MNETTLDSNNTKLAEDQVDEQGNTVAEVELQLQNALKIVRQEEERHKRILELQCLRSRLKQATEG